MRWILLGLLCMGTASAADVEMDHQMRALSVSGEPINGELPVVVRLYGSSGGEDLLFDDVFTDVPFVDGYASVRLGTKPADRLDASVFQSPTGVWLAVEVNGSVLGARQSLVSTPYAAVAGSVVGGTVSATGITVTGGGELVLGQSVATSCTTAGALVWDPVDVGVKVCDGTEFVPLGGPSTLLTIVDSAQGRTWSDGSIARSCETYRRPTSDLNLYVGNIGSGLYRIDPDGVGGASAWTAFCDMDTDDGGWTVVHSVTGANGQQTLVSNTEIGGDPETFGHYNVDRAKKMALSAISGETLFLRNDGRWLRMDRAAFDSGLAASNTDRDWSGVRLTARNGATNTSGVAGYVTFNIQSGGDYGVNSGGFDHHSGTYRHLNSNCSSQYLYSYSSASADGDAGYDVNRALGDWTVTRSCDSAEGGGLRFRTGMR